VSAAEKPAGPQGRTGSQPPDRPDQNTDSRGDHCCKNYRCGGQHGINFTQFLVSIKQTTSISGALAPYAQGGAMVDGEAPIVCVDTVLVRSG
jgi:hypothetical protein